MPRRSSKKDSPAKLAGRMKRRWRVVAVVIFIALVIAVWGLF